MLFHKNIFLSWAAGALFSDCRIQYLTTNQQGKKGDYTESYKHCFPRGGWWQVTLFIFIVIFMLVASWMTVIWNAGKNGKSSIVV